MTAHCTTCTCWIDAIIAAHNLGYYMKRYRAKHNLTQAKAARSIDMHTTNWQWYEHDAVVPSITSTKIKLQRLLENETI